MLIDKGYYDYDYQEPGDKTRETMNEAKSDEELMELLSHIGFGKATAKEGTAKKLTAEEAQAIVREEMRKDKR